MDPTLFAVSPTRLFGVFLVLVNLVSAFAVFTQIRLTFRRKNTVGLARFPWVMGTTSALLGLTYSLLITDIPFILVNLAWFTVNSIMLVLIFYYGKAPASVAAAQGAENPTGAKNR
jgi:uncharacterized protein with PQ loop repeat